MPSNRNRFVRPMSRLLFPIMVAGLLLAVLAGCGGGGSSPTSTEIVFTIASTSDDSVFSPVLTVTGSPEILWTFDDGTTSNSATPSKDFGSAGSHTAQLRVSPWSALIRINIGYDAGDGGSNTIEHVPDQHVTSVQGLDCVAPYLKQWCSSYNQITSLDFSDFVELDTIECYLSQSLTRVTLRNLPKLKRACFEDCDLKSLDLSQCPNLEDLRGAVNDYPTINFGNIGAHVWHICIRDNSQMTNQAMFSNTNDKFPNLSELFIWNDNQTGTLRISATSPTNWVSIQASGNYYTAADFSGALQNESANGEVNLSYNQIANINISGCNQITNLNLSHNQLSQTAVDGILAVLDSLGRSSDTPGSLSVNLTSNAAPSATGAAHAASLTSKGWTVEVD